MDVALAVLVVLAGVAIAALLVGLVVLLRMRRPEVGPRPGPSPWPDEAEVGRRIVLDLVVADPDAPSVQRLVQEAASRAFAAAPELQIVEVEDRDGNRLGEIRRVPPVRRDVELPSTLHEPHQRRSFTPDPVRSERAAHEGVPGPIPQRDAELVEVDTPGARAFADRYDLPASVRDRIADPDEPAAVIAAILAAAGRPVERRGEVVLSGETAIVIALVDDGGERSLSRAFLKVRESGAPYGLIVRLGYVDPVLVHQREVAAPHVRHVPASAVQRMADGVSLGADPLAFALGPPVAS